MRITTRKNSTLYAFNDLAVSKPTFDFTTFVQLAELHRIRYGYNKIYFVFVPGPKDGFRDDNLPPNDPEELRGIARNVAMPCCWLLPSCAGVSYFSTREEAKAFMAACGDHLFPRGYTLENPVADYLWPGISAAMLRGETLAPFVAPREYRNQVTAYKKLVAGDRKLITITMRESTYYPERNSRVAEWKKFINYLDPEEYAVVVVRDTEKAHSPPLFEGVPECPLASVDLGVRTALYQQSYMAMLMNNGPTTIAFYSLAPTLTFGVLAEGHAASSATFIKNVMGLNYGDQLYGFPTCQKLVWEKDNYATIKTEFEALVQLVESHPAGDYPRYGFSSKEQEIDTCRNVLGYTTLKMQRTCMDEDYATLIKIIELTEGGDANTHNLIGVYYSNKGRQDEAEQSFRAAIERDSSLKIAYMNLAATLQNKAKPKEALPVYFHILEAIEATSDVVEAAFKCALSQNDVAAANRLVQKAESMAMPADAIQGLKSRIPVAS